MKFIPAFIILILFTIFFPKVVAACSCNNNMDFASNFASMDSVFRGTALEAKQIDNYATQTKFRVNAAWKGVETTEVVVETSSICGENLIIGKEYLIFGWGKGTKIETGACTPTREIKEDDEDLKQLKEPTILLRENTGTVQYGHNNKNEAVSWPKMVLLVIVEFVVFVRDRVYEGLLSIWNVIV